MQFPADETFAPATSWFNVRLTFWLLGVAVLLAVSAAAAGYLPVVVAALSLLAVPLGCLARDLARFKRQGIALVHFDIAIRQGLFTADHASYSVFEVLVSYQQSWLGEWLGYGDVTLRCGSERFVLRGIGDVKGLSRAVARRRALFLELVRLSPASLGMLPQPQRPPLQLSPGSAPSMNAVGQPRRTPPQGQSIGG